MRYTKEQLESYLGKYVKVTFYDGTIAKGKLKTGNDFYPEKNVYHLTGTSFYRSHVTKIEEDM